MNELILTSTSRAQDAGYLALADVATVTATIGADYRLVGGHMVALLVAIYQVTGVPDRETADADLGAEYSVVGDQRLIDALADLGYTRPRSANRFVRQDHVGLEPTIDVLAPSYTGRHEANQEHGALVVDEIPGLAHTLAVPPVAVGIEARLTDGRILNTDALLPAPLPALCLKLLAYGSRHATKDAVDIWRLLAVCHAVGIRPDDWGATGSQRDAAAVLRQLTTIGSPQLGQASSDRAAQVQIRALAAAISPAESG